MATEKTILSVDLYDNVLTEAPGDYTGKVNITGTVHNENIAKDIVAERTEFRYETILMILGLADQKKIQAILGGKSVVDGVGQWLLNTYGGYSGEKPVFDPEKNGFGITYTPGRELIKGLKNLTAKLHMATTGPVINNITDSATGKVNQVLTSGKPAVIDGNTLLLKGNDPSVGVYFTPDTADGKPQKVDLVVTNTTSQIIISIPDLADGSYYLSITTQAGGNYSIVKEPRTYRFPILLTVGGGEEERPGEL
ncbi:DUF4469 domain-containing protein [uncultured Parabacteroides sp.]|uniref:DUF4469 domain-containing protein n=1 Tax=uncultured Parabacteroides sp. TaxID=512312 RepID=UPI002632477C|nr:DUF4469 domain-containing protein [uncultured Parabacteroides sp.]